MSGTVSIDHEYDQRMAAAETSIGVLADSMVKVVKSVEDLSEKTEHINTTVARMEANQGKLPTNALLGWLSFAITLVAFIGVLFINPIKEKVDRNTRDMNNVPVTLKEDIRYETDLKLKPIEDRLLRLENASE